MNHVLQFKKHTTDIISNKVVTEQTSELRLIIWFTGNIYSPILLFAKVMPGLPIVASTGVSCIPKSLANSTHLSSTLLISYQICMISR